MSKTREFTLQFTDDELAFIERKVASGEYASPNAVVRDGLSELMEHDLVIERWLREEVVPTVRRMDEDPSRGIPAEDVFEELHRRATGAVKAAE